MQDGDGAMPGLERHPVVPPDGGAAWRALYVGPAPEIEPVEDDEADVEGAQAA